MAALSGEQVACRTPSRPEGSFARRVNRFKGKALSFWLQEAHVPGAFLGAAWQAWVRALRSHDGGRAHASQNEDGPGPAPPSADACAERSRKNDGARVSRGKRLSTAR